MTSHYQQQLVEQLRAAEDELGQRRRQVAELTEQRDTAQATLALLHQGEEPYENEQVMPTPAQWIWRWNRITPDRRLELATRVLAAGEEASTCFVENHLSRLAAHRNCAEQAEARIAAIRALHRPAPCGNAGCSGQWCVGCDPDGLDNCDDHPYPCATIRALDDTEPAPFPEQPITVRTIGHWRRACLDCRQLAHPGWDCDQATEQRARYEAAMAAVLERFDRESSHHLGAAFTCDHQDSKKLGARPGDLAIICQCGAEVFPSPFPTQARP
ncbi:hypothetical protein ABT093_09835 [Kitasatospora sp. NPDC002551]|uniref:hypothetical protein n=1 Tax=Kitasatospora sp. NPDC002551 TaxID=3154539 RepID=UPI003327918A